MTIWKTAFALVAMAAVPALAHEGHAHKLMGTVTAVHADKGHVELKNPKGEAESFYVDKSTKYRAGAKALTLADLKPGARVVVEAKTVSDRLLASSVRIGGAGKPQTAASPAAPHH